jgi:hypothetical protein
MSPPRAGLPRTIRTPVRMLARSPWKPGWSKPGRGFANSGRLSLLAIDCSEPNGHSDRSAATFDRTRVSRSDAHASVGSRDGIRDGIRGERVVVKTYRWPIVGSQRVVFVPSGMSPPSPHGPLTQRQSHPGRPVMIGGQDPAPWLASRGPSLESRRAQAKSRRGTRRSALIVLLALLLTGCAGDVDPYRSAVDALAFPPAWQATKTIARGNGGEAGCVQLADAMCPSITRYYSVPGALPDLYQQARAALTQSGFSDLVDNAPACDLNTNAARCSILARRDTMQIQIGLYPAGADVDALGIGVAGESTVRIIAQHR